jgi:hypothetical protein
MILHIPVLRKKDGQIMVSSRVETHTPVPNLPENLWYRFPESYEPYLSARADGFAATALLSAMFFGENLDIRAPISPKLAYNLLEYRNIFHSWLPGIFKMVDVRYEVVEIDRPSSKGTAVGTAFSGGVDSFYTLWSHLAQNQPIEEARITHGLFLHGFDLRLDEERAFQSMTGRYAAFFNNLGLELLTASTNAYQFSEFRFDWLFFFGAALLGAAGCLSPLFTRFYIPSGPSYTNPRPNGSSALIDHLLSTEHMDIVHHGASITRFDKMAVVTQWPVTYDLLRVCAHRTQSAEIMNCSACHKCYRAMSTLHILNAADKYSTLNPKLTPIDFFRWGLQTHVDLEMAADIRKQAWKRGKIGMALGVWMVMAIHPVVKIGIKIVKFLLPRRIIYRIKRTHYQPEANQQSDDL